MNKLFFIFKSDTCAYNISYVNYTLKATLVYLYDL